jgi:hypothetical protein
MHAMGRQLAVALGPGDETAFLAFLRERCDLAIFRTPAPTPDEIWLDALPPRRPHGLDAVYLWNRDFPWDPQPAPTTIGTWYVPGTGQAPVLEYARDPLRRGPAHQHGRVYWARVPSADGAFEAGGVRYDYDVAEFGRWYDAVVRWLRKAATPVPGTTPVLHCLPDAARHYGVR